MKTILILGQSLYELVFAIGIAAIIITGVLVVSTTSVRNSTYSKNNSQATKYAQEEMEWLRGQRDAGWDSFVTNIDTGGCTAGNFSWGGLGGNCTVGDIYTRTANFTCRDSAGGVVMCDSTASMVDASVSISWTDAQGDHIVTSVSKFTDWNK